MSARLPRISEQHAQALSARSTTYADEHAASLEVRFSRPTHEMSSRELVGRLLAEFSDEVPTTLHEGPDHIDAGGVPAMKPAFLAYLDASPNDVLYREPRVDTQGNQLRPVIVGEYRKPLQACIAGMKRSKGKVAWWGAIVERILLGSESPVHAAMAEGSHQHEAHRTANEALSECHRRLTPTKMDLAPRERIA